MLNSIPMPFDYTQNWKHNLTIINQNQILAGYWFIRIIINWNIQDPILISLLQKQNFKILIKHTLNYFTIMKWKLIWARTKYYAMSMLYKRYIPEATKSFKIIQLDDYVEQNTKIREKNQSNLFWVSGSEKIWGKTYFLCRKTEIMIFVRRIQTLVDRLTRSIILINEEEMYDARFRFRVGVS